MTAEELRERRRDPNAPPALIPISRGDTVKIIQEPGAGIFYVYGFCYRGDTRYARLSSMLTGHERTVAVSELRYAVKH